MQMKTRLPLSSVSPGSLGVLGDKPISLSVSACVGELEKAQESSLKSILRTHGVVRPLMATGPGEGVERWLHR